MRVLLVLPEPPAPFGGAAARWYHVLMKGLVDRGAHTTALVCSGTEKNNNEAICLYGKSTRLEIFDIKRRTIWTRFGTFLRPYSYPFSPRMIAAVNARLVQEFDVIRFETTFTAWTATHPPSHAELNILNLYSIDNSTNRYETTKEKFMHRRLLSSEMKLLRRFNRISTLTDRLSTTISRFHPTAEIRVTPMTIDPDLYDFVPPTPTSDGARTLGLIGSFNWAPTLSAGHTLVNQIWPRIKSALPTTRLLLVGRAADAAFGYLKNQPDIEICSDVDDTIPFFRRLDLMIYLPTAGSGMKVKIMEAIALGTPVLTNKEGAEGLPELVAAEITVSDVDEAIDRVLHPRETDFAVEVLRQRRLTMFHYLSPGICVDRVCELR